MRNGRVCVAVLVLMCALGQLPSGAGDGGRAAPVANAGPDQSALANETVYFDGSGSSDPDNDTLTYSWDFDRSNGIQQDASGPKVSHAYSQPGAYRVTLRVSDGTLFDVDECNVTVTEPGGNQPPTAVISEPRNGDIAFVANPVTFDGSNSSDPEGKALTYLWEFGDGEVGTGKKTAHAYSSVGLYIANLTVNDSKLSNTAQVLLNIIPFPSSGNFNTPPNADAGPNQTGYTNQSLYFLSFSTDPQANNLTYYWDWDQSDGVSFFQPEGTGKTCSTAYQAAGNFTVTHWVIEENTPQHYFSMDTCWANISAVPTYPPLAEAGPAVAGEVNTEVTLSGSGLSRNPGGSIQKFEWDLDGDGVYDWESQTTGKARHVYTAVRDYLAKLRVTDEIGQTATDTTNVTISAKPNILPVANAGDDLSTFVGQPVTFRGSASDEDGQVVDYKWDYQGDGVWDHENPSSGTGSYTYTTPGTFEARLRVTDDRGGIAEDSTLVTVVQDQPPVANAGGDQTVSAGETVQFDGTASRDPEGQRVSFTWDFDDRDGLGTEATGPQVEHVYLTGGEFTATLTVTDELGKSARDTALITVVQTAGVSVSTSPKTRTLKPGEEAGFSVRVVNSGNGRDTFSLVLSGENSRWGTLSREEVTLDPGATQDVALTVSPAVDASADDRARLTIRAVSSFDSSAVAQAEVIVTVSQVFSSTCTPEKTAVTVEAGKSATFSVTVLNTGNGEDRVKLEAAGASGKWVSFSPSQASLPEGSSKLFSVKVSVPRGAAAQNYLLQITATSQDNSTVSMASLTLTVKPGKGPGFLPGFELLAALAALAGVAVSGLLRRRG